MGHAVVQMHITNIINSMATQVLAALVHSTKQLVLTQALYISTAPINANLLPVLQSYWLYANSGSRHIKWSKVSRPYSPCADTGCDPCWGRVKV